MIFFAILWFCNLDITGKKMRHWIEIHKIIIFRCGFWMGNWNSFYKLDGTDYLQLKKILVLIFLHEWLCGAIFLICNIIIVKLNSKINKISGRAVVSTPITYIWRHQSYKEYYYVFSFYIRKVPVNRQFSAFHRLAKLITLMFDLTKIWQPVTSLE